MPVHAHDGAERLKPEGMSKTAQQFVTTVVEHDRLCDDGTELRHAVAEPFRNSAPVEREIRAA
jgi:hypothetical protein